jgi:hypothetical protein
MTTFNEDRGLELRTKAFALLQEAAAADGLRAFAVNHSHKFGVSSYLVWAREMPTEEQAEKVLDSAFEPDRGETMDISPSFNLDEVAGISVKTRLIDEQVDGEADASAQARERA